MNRESLYLFSDWFPHFALVFSPDQDQEKHATTAVHEL